MLLDERICESDGDTMRAPLPGDRIMFTWHTHDAGRMAAAFAMGLVSATALQAQRTPPTQAVAAKTVAAKTVAAKTVAMPPRPRIPHGA